MARTNNCGANRNSGNETSIFLAWVLMPPLADILHRTLVVGLLGVTVAGVGVGWAVHKDTLRRGQGSSSVFAICYVLLHSGPVVSNDVCPESFSFCSCHCVHCCGNGLICVRFILQRCVRARMLLSREFTPMGHSWWTRRRLRLLPHKG